MTGKSSRLSASTCGSTSSGSWSAMRFTAESSFCSANARSVPYVKLAVTRERPVELVVDVDSRPVMPWMAVSMGVETSVFTMSGDAPG